MRRPLTWLGTRVGSSSHRRSAVATVQATHRARRACTAAGFAHRSSPPSPRKYRLNPTQKRSLLALAAFATLIGGPAQAQYAASDSYFDGGIGAGQSRASIDRVVIDVKALR